MAGDVPPSRTFVTGIRPVGRPSPPSLSFSKMLDLLTNGEGYQLVFTCSSSEPVEDC